MTTNEPADWADLLNLILTAAKGVFPGPALEELIDRMEART